MIWSQAATQLSTGPAHSTGWPSTNRMSPVKTVRSSGTWTSTSPRVCAGPTVFSVTFLSPTLSFSSSSNTRVGRVLVTSSHLNLLPITSCRKAPASPSWRQLRCMAASSSAGRSFISSAQAREAMISASLTSWLPKVWSPLEWVLTSRPIDLAAGTAARIRSSISAVSLRSNSVSTSKVWSRSTIRPALLHPQLPSGCRYAKQPLPRSCRPLVYCHFAMASSYVIFSAQAAVASAIVFR